MIRKIGIVSLLFLFCTAFFMELGSTISSGEESSDETPCMKPKIIRLIPGSGKWGDTIRIKGRRFGLKQGKVTFNGVPAEILTWRTETIYVKVPEKTKSGPVIVNNGCDNSNEIPFTIETLPQER